MNIYIAIGMDSKAQKIGCITYSVDMDRVNAAIETAKESGYDDYFIFETEVPIVNQRHKMLKWFGKYGIEEGEVKIILLRIMKIIDDDARNRIKK
jgi:hypothetical protein